jgi:hypothetical protein
MNNFYGNLGRINILLILFKFVFNLSLFGIFQSFIYIINGVSNEYYL